MNILLINHEKGGGGASFSLFELTQELIKRGHHIFILTPYKDGMLIDLLNQLPVVIVFEKYFLWEGGHFKKAFWINEKFKLKWLFYYKWKNIKIAHKLTKFVTDNKIDIIHSNTSVVNMGALISKYSGIPHVWHLREFGDIDIKVKFYDSEFLAFHFMNKYTSKFICVSKAVYNYYPKLIQGKKVVIYNGVSPSNISEEQHIPNNVVNIVIIGNIIESKGQHEAVAACALLMKQGISNFILNIVGSGNIYFDIPNELKNKVKLLGKCNNVAMLRKSMDIELVCSRCEAFGRATVEAMLSGLTVIGTNSGGTPELINHGVNGFLYNSGDITELCNLLKYLILNPEVRCQIGNHSREFAKERFLISRCADEVENVYSELLKS